jgi:hypothetical protein
MEPTHAQSNAATEDTQNTSPPQNADPTTEESNAPVETNAQQNAESTSPATTVANAPVETNAQENAESTSPATAVANAPVENQPTSSDSQSNSTNTNHSEGNQTEQRQNEEAAGGKTGYEKRFEVLKRKLVTERKAAKEERDEVLGDSSAGNSDASFDKHIGRLDKVTKYTDIGAGLIGDNIGKLPENKQAYGTMAGGGVGALSSLFKITSNSAKAIKDKNKNKKNAHRLRAISSAMGVVSGAATMTGGMANLGFWKTDGSSDAMKRTAGGLAIGSSVASFGSTMLNFFADRSETKGRKKVAQGTDSYRRRKMQNADPGQALEASREKLKALKAKKAADMNDDEKIELKAERMKRHTAKAQKYAMEQAARLNETRSKEPDIGKVGLIGSGISALSSIAGSIGGMFGKNSLFGTIGSMVAKIGGAVGKGVSEKAAKKQEEGKAKVSAELKERKSELVDRYLKDKTPRIKEQAKAMQLSESEQNDLGENGKELSDLEVRKIIAMRLGFEEKASDYDSDVTDQNKIFEKLTEKRANNILKSDPEEKKQMLSALGLEEDASVEDVKKVLMAS